MRYLYISALLLFFSCSDSSKEDNSNNNGSTQKKVDKVIPIDTLGEWVKIVAQQPTGVLRGVALGQPMSEVNAKEHEDKNIVSEEDAHYITYTLNLEDMGGQDIIDVKYEFDKNQKVKAIQVKVIEVNGVDTFVEDFKQYFDLRYTPAKAQADTLYTWNSPQGYKVKLQRNKDTGGVLIDIR